MPPDQDAPSAENARVIQLLRDQVDELQIKAAEKSAPWYRQTPSLTSVLALLLSIATAVYSGVEGHRQDVQKKQEALRTLVSTLLDLSSEQQAKLNAPEAAKLSAAEREFIGGLLESKRVVVAEATDNLVRDIPNDVSSSEYNILANDKRSNGNSAKAEEYLKKAVAVSQEPLTKMAALRFLAGFYSSPGPFQDMNLARKRFQEAVDQISGEPRDDATAYAVGFTWEMWGTAEYANKFPEAGREKIEKARKYYGELSPGNALRNWALVFLDARIQPYINNTAAQSLPPITPPPMQSPGVAASPSG